MADTAKIRLNVFDGARRPLSSDLDIRVSILDRHGRLVVDREQHKGPSIEFAMPFHNNRDDDYRVVADAEGHIQAGFMPVSVSPDKTRVVDLMLLRKGAMFDLGGASWSRLAAASPHLIEVLKYGARDEDEAERRYADLAARRPEAVACMLNVFTAMEGIRLSGEPLLKYFKGLRRWDELSIKQDRFYAYCDQRLFDEVSRARHLFQPEKGFKLFHPGATSSFKETQFGEGNVQLSFHDGEDVPSDLPGCTVVEADIDYYKDLAAHGLLEVIPNDFAGPTDPKTAYVLRWIAARHPDGPPFDPPYVIV